MHVTYLIHPHNYFIIEGANGDFYIRIWRSMRDKAFVGMSQPVPNSAIMGLDTQMLCLYNRKPAEGKRWELIKNEEVIQADIVPEDGKIYGLKLDLSDECTCDPWLSHKNIRCDVMLPTYQLHIYD